MANELKIYIAGKVSENSIFGKHHWRDEFCAELEKYAERTLINLDPLKVQEKGMDYKQIFNKDCQLINQADIVIVYLSDDISVGGSQEILIARYLHKPVIGLAPRGGKFNGSTREMLGHIIEDYQDPFVFTTCDVVCTTVEEVGLTLRDCETLTSSGLSIIDVALS